ncbi:MAG: alpha/beta fold hydrolase [Rhizobiaceae bacterium]|nr:alpha/beta fold hydrolase [Rhizobiaceae bacterium]
MPDGYDDHFIPAADRLALHARVYASGESTRPPVVCLAGLTRNARDFHELALHLSRRATTPRRVVAIDSRGRGASARDADAANYTLAIEARDVLSVLDGLDLGGVHCIGTSRGGLIIHLLAAAVPERLRSVILNDVGPELGLAGLAHIRDYLSSPMSAPQTMAEAEAIQRAIHGPAFPALTSEDWARMTAAIYRNEAGRPVADFDPAISDAFKAVDLSKPLPTLWAQFDAMAGIPMMAVRGGNSLLLSAETLREMAARHRGLEVIEVDGQGHPPMLETGDLPERIAAFLSAAD